MKKIKQKNSELENITKLTNNLDNKINKQKKKLQKAEKPILEKLKAVNFDELEDYIKDNPNIERRKFYQKRNTYSSNTLLDSSYPKTDNNDYDVFISSKFSADEIISQYEKKSNEKLNILEIKECKEYINKIKLSSDNNTDEDIRKKLNNSNNALMQKIMSVINN